RRRHTISKRDWSSDVCSSDLAHIGVLEAVPLFGQRRQVFGEQRQLMHRNRDLALLGAEHLALHADDIADIEFLVALVDLVAYIRSEERRVGKGWMVWCARGSA